MIDPTVNATPARKNSRPTISPAAARFSAKPVSEIVLGVRRDSISRLRIISWAVGPVRGGRVRRGAPLLPARGGRVRSGVLTPRGAPGRPWSRGGADERPSVRPGPRQQPLRQQRGYAGGEGPEEHVREVVVGGRHHHERDEQWVEPPGDPAGAP